MYYDNRMKLGWRALVCIVTNNGGNLSELEFIELMNFSNYALMVAKSNSVYIFYSTIF